VGPERWEQACTCAGSIALREREAIVAARVEGEKTRTQTALREADIRPGDSAQTIQGKLRTAFAANDVPVHSDFSRISRFIAAGQARRGTRTVRLVAESARGLRAAARLGPLPARDSENGRELHRIHRSLGILCTAATAAFVAARLTTDGRRIAFAVVGGFLSLLTSVFAVLALAVGTIFRAAAVPTNPGHEADS
jgi:hypothetical protein